MKRTHDLSELDWKVAGFIPHEWRLDQSMEIGATARAEIPPIPARVPGSVQQALLTAGLLPDWNKGLNARLCEWVENRHWIYEVKIPDEWLQDAQAVRLRCLGLDYCGSIRLNSCELHKFHNSPLPCIVDLTRELTASDNVLQIVFECPPRWLGQFGFTSQMTDWKPRFNYFWDWTSRLVQIGIWDKAFVEVNDQQDWEEIENLKTVTDFDIKNKIGKLEISGSVQGDDNYLIRAELMRGASVYYSEEMSLPDFLENSMLWDNLKVQLWWPNGLGEQPLYSLKVKLLNELGQEIDRVERRVGFKRIDWEKCEDAPGEADPWICVVNSCPTFLQGVNWSPIRPNFADVTEKDYRKRLELYRDLGVNILRVWGGGFLEKECFYNLCDQLGLMVWQEFPLSSSGVENWPPDDEISITELSEIVRSYISRRQHHVSLIIWCGGNELQAERPVGLEHPLIKRFHDIVQEMDPGRRFLPTSPSGPRVHGHKEDYGKGVHWDVHGPWKPSGKIEDEWIQYWQEDDSLMRSEVGAPGPCSADLTRRYKGDCDEVPGSIDNPLWRRSPWWIEWPQFVVEKGHEPENLEEYVAWGQERQAQALRIAARSCKNRFPKCGGFIVWMGHDCFPCTANTSIVDFEANPKAAVLALAEVFKQPKRLINRSLT